MILFTNSFVVDLHVVVDSFLVTEVIVVLHFAVLKQIVRSYIFFLLLFLFLAFLASAYNLAVLRSAVVGCG